LGIRVWVRVRVRVRVRVYPYLYGRSPVNDDDETDRLHTPGTSTETGAPEVAAASDVDDGQMTEMRRGCRERGSIDVQG